VVIPAVEAGLHGGTLQMWVLHVLRGGNLFKIGSRADGIGETEGKAAMGSGE
jgi:hypothetical protein